MGTSFVEFKSKGYWLNDGHLELQLHLLAKEIDRVPDPSPWLLDLKAHWKLQSVIRATGCIAPGLDDFLTSADRVAQIRRVVVAVHREVMARTVPWSAEKGRGEHGFPVEFMGDVPNTWVVQGVEALIKLLDGNLQPHDGSLKLPMIEPYEVLAFQEPGVQGISRLWSNLVLERFIPEPGEILFERLFQNPWESSDSRVNAAWEELTRPEQIPSLEALTRLFAATPAAPGAAAWAERALAASRSRRS